MLTWLVKTGMVLDFEVFLKCEDCFKNVILLTVDWLVRVGCRVLLLISISYFWHDACIDTGAKAVPLPRAVWMYD